MWIAEALEQLGAFEMAYRLYRAASFKWKAVSPPKSDRAHDAAARLAQVRPSLRELNNESEGAIEAAFRRWLVHRAG